MINWIYGNTLPIVVQLLEVVKTQEGKTTEDYIPPAGSEIQVWAIGKFNKKQYDYTLEGNALRFTEDGTLNVGTYGIRITVLEPNSRKLRSFKCGELRILDCTEELELGEFLQDGAAVLDATSFFWAKGDKGDKGEQGDTGNGIASITQNADYTITITLDDGTTYTTDVLRGAKGEQGAKGDTGNGIASATLNADYTLTLTFTDGATYTTPSIRGEKGEKGDTGTTDYNELQNKPDLSIYMQGVTQQEFNNIYNFD